MPCHPRLDHIERGGPGAGKQAFEGDVGGQRAPVSRHDHLRLRARVEGLAENGEPLSDDRAAPRAGGRERAEKGTGGQQKQQELPSSTGERPSDGIGGKTGDDGKRSKRSPATRKPMQSGRRAADRRRLDNPRGGSARPAGTYRLCFGRHRFRL
jgi:hypothetical protein